MVAASERCLKATPIATSGGGWWTDLERGLAGSAIRLEARIGRITDAFNAVMNRRPCAAPRSLEQALIELDRCKGRLFDAELVEPLVPLVRDPALAGRLRALRAGPFPGQSSKAALTRRYHAGCGTLRTFGSHRIRHATATLLVNKRDAARGSQALCLPYDARWPRSPDARPILRGERGARCGAGGHGEPPSVGSEERRSLAGAGLVSASAALRSTCQRY